MSPPTAGTIAQEMPEAVGVVPSVVLDTRDSRSFLFVLDTLTFQELARAEAPHHISFGFHGQFLGAS